MHPNRYHNFISSNQAQPQQQTTNLRPMSTQNLHTGLIKLNKMTTKNIVIIISTLLTFSHVVANPIESNNNQQINKNSYYPILAQFPTTNSPDTSIEDPLEAGAPTTIQNLEELCEFKCYNNVIEAQALFAEHVSLMKKEKSLIRRKSKITLSDGPDIVRSPKSKPNQQPNSRRTSGSVSATNSDNNYTSYSSTTTNSAPRSPTIRSLTGYQNEQIVVSRLRVARSTNRIHDDHEPLLRQLRLKLEKKFNETCKSLWAVQNCLGDISKQCIGNLHYHSYDVVANQWFEKLNCPPSRNPNFIPYKVLTRSVPRDDIEKIPIARPVSSKEATRDKLMKMGVVLSPTLNNQPTQSRLANSPIHLLDPHRTLNRSQYTKNPNLIIAQAILIGCILTLMLGLIILTAFYFKRPPKI